MNLVVSKNMAVAIIIQQRRDVLLSVCGPKMYHILRDLLWPIEHITRATYYVDIVSRQPEAGSGVSLVQESSVWQC